MAILKYTDKNGVVHSVNSYKVNNVIVTQSKGESTADVMSQKAVTDELKSVSSLIPTKVSQLSNDSGYLTQHQSLADYAKTTDVNSKVKTVSDNLATEVTRATNAENDIKTEVNKKVAAVTIEQDGTNSLQYHLMVDGKKSGDINIPKDQFLSNVEYSDATKVITFTFETTTGTTTTDVNISDLVDTYTSGNGLSLDGNKFSVKKDAASQKYIEVSASGVKIVGVDEALAKKVDNTTYSTDKTTINAAIATKANTTDVNTSLDKKADKETTYTKSDVDSLVATMDGGEY